MHMNGACGEQKRTSDSLKLKSQKVVSHLVSAGNQTHWKSSQCAQLLKLLFNSVLLVIYEPYYTIIFAGFPSVSNYNFTLTMYAT